MFFFLLFSALKVNISTFSLFLYYFDDLMVAHHLRRWTNIEQTPILRLSLYTILTQCPNFDAI